MSELKSNKFTVQVNSSKGLTAKAAKNIEDAINETVKKQLANLDFKATVQFRLPGGATQGIYADIKDELIR